MTIGFLSGPRSDCDESFDWYAESSSHRASSVATVRFRLGPGQDRQENQLLVMAPSVGHAADP
jgi:hypothetical protein